MKDVEMSSPKTIYTWWDYQNGMRYNQGQMYPTSTERMHCLMYILRNCTNYTKKEWER